MVAPQAWQAATLASARVHVRAGPHTGIGCGAAAGGNFYCSLFYRSHGFIAVGALCTGDLARRLHSSGF